MIVLKKKVAIIQCIFFRKKKVSIMCTAMLLCDMPALARPADATYVGTSTTTTYVRPPYYRHFVRCRTVCESPSWLGAFSHMLCHLAAKLCIFLLRYLNDRWRCKSFFHLRVSTITMKNEDNDPFESETPRQIIANVATRWPSGISRQI